MLLNKYKNRKRTIGLMIHNSYFPDMRNIILIIFLLMSMGCPPSEKVMEDVWLQSVSFDFIQSTNELYFDVDISSSFQDTDLSEVNILWYCSTYDNEPDTIQLNDNGLDGDILPGDDHYSVKIANDSLELKNDISPTTTGEVFLNVLAKYGSGEETLGFTFQLGNIKPTILSVSFPDTLIRPLQTNSFVVDTIKVTVHDANGLSDIQSCFLLFQKPDSTWANNGNPILLFDDGVISEQMFLWDENASDGIYSRLITIGRDNPLGTYRAHFHVRDIAGDYGDSVIKTLEIINE